MQLHQDVISKDGYCWFGKLGRAPSDKVLKQIWDDGKGYVILYARDGAYLAYYTEVTEKKPIEAYPEYYKTLLYDEGYVPSMYFKLCALELVSMEELQDLVISSSRSPLVETLYKSMNSFFCAEYKGERELVKGQKSVKETVKKEQTSVNGCRYRENGKCNRKGFVNFQYECERPNQCIGQKL